MPSLELFYTALAVSLPTFGWVLTGVALNRLGLLRKTWVDGFSRFAFNCGLPLMLFSGAVQVDYSRLAQARYLLAGVLTTLLATLLSWAYSRWRGHPGKQRGLFVQAAFRSNLAIVGLALCISAYGERGAVLAALPIAIMTMLYNVLAVWVLDTTHGSRTTPRSIALGVLRNPLIIGIGAGVIVSLSGIILPAPALRVVGVLSGIFLPLLLLCVGASISLAQLRRAGTFTLEATMWRLLLVPALGVAVGLALGVRGDNLGVLFLLLSSPVATASFVMVVAARGDGELAANLIVFTTLASVVTVTVGFMVLVWLGLVGQLA